MQRPNMNRKLCLSALTMARAPIASILLSTFALSGSAFPIHSAGAQSRQVVIIVAQQVHVTPGAQASLPIGFSDEHAVPRQAMLVFRGLPPGTRFSEGRSFGPGVWVAPAANAGKLVLFVPAGASGEIPLNVQLATLEGETLTNTRITLSTAPQTTGSTGTGTTNSVSASLVPRSAISEEDRASALKMMKKADEYMANGSVIVARRLYQGAAERGLGEAAYALAKTYDARELAKIQSLVGIQADAALANKWYGKAVELGYSKGAAR